MELKQWKTMETASKTKLVKEVKNNIIGSYREKKKFWDLGILETLLSNLDELEMSPELLINAYSIFVCYTNFSEAYDLFKFSEFFLEKVIDNMTKAIELSEDGRIIDLCLQIIRNLLKNDIISYEHIVKSNLMGIFEKLLNSNKRINLIAQIISKMANTSDEMKIQILEQQTILDSIIDCLESKGNDNFRISILECLISLSNENYKLIQYIRQHININLLISLIKYQNNELNAKVAYLATILNTENKIFTGDFENLMKQIIYQITRMLQSKDIDDVLQGTAMLLNLVKHSGESLTKIEAKEKDQDLLQSSKAI